MGFNSVFHRLLNSQPSDGVNRLKLVGVRPHHMLVLASCFMISSNCGHRVGVKCQNLFITNLTRLLGAPCLKELEFLLIRDLSGLCLAPY